MGTIVIRPCEAEDIEAAVRVWERARWDAQQPHMVERVRYTHEGNVEHFRDVVVHENDVWLAVVDGDVVGLLTFGDDIVRQIHVDPARQRMGVGTALMDHAKALMPGGITLSTFQGNTKSRSFYERSGFRAVEFGVSPHPENEPDVTYAWTPDSGD